ncbi:MAG: transglutaminase family protein [Blastococcus sp.]
MTWPRSAEADVRTTGAAALATLFGACALSPVYSSGAWFPPLFVAVLVIAAGGLLMRAYGPAAWARLAPGRPVSGRLAAAGIVLVPLVQVALLACVLTTLFAPRRAFAGVLPTRTSLARLGTVLADGAAELREQATPALPLAGLLALTTLFVGLIAVAIDLIAVAGRQGALAGLGLLVLYCVPVSTITGGIGVVAIALPAAGLALLLWADQRRRLVVRESRTSTGVAAGGGAAVRITFSALVAALVLGAVVPTLAEGSLTTGLGGGSGSATGTSLDPTAALRGQLTLSQPLNLLHVDASVRDPGYLRALSLDRYDNARGWSLSNLDGEQSIAGSDHLAPLSPGELYSEVNATIQVVGHDDRFLPVFSDPQTIRVSDNFGDDWRFDQTSGTVFGRGVSTSGHRYSVTAEEPLPTTELLAAAAPLPDTDPLQRRFTALPATLDVRVTDLVSNLTDGASAPYARVRRIYDYLTDPANGFIYNLSTAPGTSGNDLVDFLRLRRGYCEQYAGAMAVMVRAAGVPARVALGYTPGTRLSDGTRMITSSDAHAWVEVYFHDLGWVPFDPTPIQVERRVALPWAPRADAATPTASGPDVATPTSAAPAGPTTIRDRGAGGVPTAGGPQKPSGTLRPLLTAAGVLLLVVAVLSLPAGLRGLQRRRRLADGGAGALWDELTATAADLGLRVHPAWTPRRTAAELGAAMGGPDGSGGRAAADAALRLALGEEAASYGPRGPHPAAPELAGALRTARRGLLTATPRRGRLRAALWPASLVTGVGQRLAARVGRWTTMPGRARKTGRTRTV